MPVDPGFAPVVRAAKAPPLMGGTMLVTQDGAFAVISDPPRDSIHIVDLRSWEETGTIALADGALPFRGAEDGSGRVHISLRGTGELVTIDPGTASVTATTQICPNPRGLAYDPGAESLHVACAGGLLVTRSASGQTSQRYLAPDLRDVIVSDGRLFVSRFRAAELLEVTDDGATLAGAPVSLVEGTESREPTTAWRTLARPEGGWIMLHQSASTDPVPGFEEPDADGSTPSDGGYGSAVPCSAVVNPTLSATGEDGIVRNAGILGGLALAVDVALSPDGRKVAIATPSQQDMPEEGLPRLSAFELDLDSLQRDTDVRCEIPPGVDVDDDIAAVAYQPDGALLAQARDRAMLYRVDGLLIERLELQGPEARDTGFELFHYDTGGGISCASCHPEGMEDGRTWIFEDLGPRRTQALNVGLEGTAPFHWKGDMDDIHMIARQVRQGAMGGIEQSEARQAALAEWIFALRPPNPLRSSSEASVAEGRELFVGLGCASCHAGESFTSPASADLGRGPLQTPALRGVALRPPYMHDGRSRTLSDAVLDMTQSTSPGTSLDEAELASVVAYLESL